MKTYKLKYKFEFDTNEEKGWSDENKEESPLLGYTDALFIASCIYDEDGSLSHKFASIDGEEGNFLSALEVFKILGSLAHTLSEEETLGSADRLICKQLLDMIRLSKGITKEV